jgi:hypothetical protein
VPSPVAISFSPVAGEQLGEGIGRRVKAGHRGQASAIGALTLKYLVDHVGITSPTIAFIPTRADLVVHPVDHAGTAASVSLWLEMFCNRVIERIDVWRASFSAS